MIKIGKINTSSKLKTIQLVTMGMFIALAMVGSFIKIPSLFGTVALDTAPAFLAALLLGPIVGGIVAFTGHLLTSLNVGLPLTLPIHLLIAAEMALICIVVGFIYKKGRLKLALFVGLLLNGVGAPALPFFTAMVVPLLIGSAVNLIIAWVLVRTLKGRVRF
jgi:riboflavin transporter